MHTVNYMYMCYMYDTDTVTPIRQSTKTCFCTGMSKHCRVNLKMPWAVEPGSKFTFRPKNTTSQA